jgi:hypothetical protein
LGSREERIKLVKELSRAKPGTALDENTHDCIASDRDSRLLLILIHYGKM